MKRCRGNPSNLPTVCHWMLQKFCNLSCTECCRNSATTRPLDVAEILNHSRTGCCWNSATIYTLGVAEILWPIILKVLQKLCDHSYTGCHKNYVTTPYTGCHRNSVTTHTLSVAEILQQLIRWVSQKFCNHSFTRYRRNSVSTHTLNFTETQWPLIH